MRLSKHDLFQMDDESLKKLPAELLLEASKRLLHDVKELLRTRGVRSLLLPKARRKT
jgi:hypothetical protein